MRFVDYYEVMGLSPEATPDEIKKAYRRLARKFHPDVSKEANAEEKFKQLGEAYEVLKDPTRRAEYDELRRYGGRDGTEFTPPPGWQSRGGEAPDPQAAQRFSEFFEAIFGRGAGGARQSAAWPGEDIHYAVQVSLEEAQRGGIRTITLTAPPQMPGQAPEAKTLKVTIPKGIQAGRQIRLKGQGHPGHGNGRAGDLFLHIEYAPHRLFTVDGSDLTLVLPVSPWEATLGASVTVPTLEGSVKMSIPANSQAGRKLRLAGKGLAGATPGDLYVVLQVVVPATPTARERELLAQLAQESQFNPRAGLGV